MYSCFVFTYTMYLLTFLFFFKQKTAYEMRISDWSSDVCSSDLLPRDSHRSVGITGQVLFQPTSDLKFLLSADYSEINQPSPTQEIGRASCRERVCQYV